MTLLATSISIHSPRVGRDAGERKESNDKIYFNPLSPRGERLDAEETYKYFLEFQSTLPAWGETLTALKVKTYLLFQSTLPAWGETITICSACISRHYFNPLSPRGERHTTTCVHITGILFQSTLPAWGETKCAPTLKEIIMDFNPLSPRGERRWSA